MKNNKISNKNDKNITNRTGRPPISEISVRKLEDAFKSGLNITESCLYANISRVTFYKYLRENEEFSYKIEYSQRFVFIKAKQNIARRIVEGDIELSKWFLEKRDDDFKPNRSTIKVVKELSYAEIAISEEKNKKLIARLNSVNKNSIDWKSKFEALQKERSGYEK